MAWKDRTNKRSMPDWIAENFNEELLRKDLQQMDNWEELTKALAILIKRAEGLADACNHPSSDDMAILKLKESHYWATRHN